MPVSSRSLKLKPRTGSDTLSNWEARSTNRVIEIGQDQILDRSRRIVDAAYDLLDEEGLEGITIRAVLERTGLSRRAFYERFADKDELMLAVFEETIRLATSYYASQIASMPDPLERLKLIVTSIGLGKGSKDADARRTNRRGAAMSREHLRLAESRPEDLQAALAPLIDLIARQLSDGIQVGVVREANPQRLASLVYNLVATTMHTEFLAQEKLRPDRARREALTRDIWEFCLRAVARST